MVVLLLHFLATFVLSERHYLILSTHKRMRRKGGKEWWYFCYTS